MTIHKFPQRDRSRPGRRLAPYRPWVCAVACALICASSHAQSEAPSSQAAAAALSSLIEQNERFPVPLDLGPFVRNATLEQALRAKPVAPPTDWLPVTLLVDDEQCRMFQVPHAMVESVCFGVPKLVFKGPDMVVTFNSLFFDGFAVSVTPCPAVSVKAYARGVVDALAYTHGIPEEVATTVRGRLSSQTELDVLHGAFEMARAAPPTMDTPLAEALYTSVLRQATRTMGKSEYLELVGRCGRTVIVQSDGVAVFKTGELSVTVYDHEKALYEVNIMRRPGFRRPPADDATQDALVRIATSVLRTALKLDEECPKTGEDKHTANTTPDTQGEEGSPS